MFWIIGNDRDGFLLIANLSSWIKYSRNPCRISRLNDIGFRLYGSAAATGTDLPDMQIVFAKIGQNKIMF